MRTVLQNLKASFVKKRVTESVGQAAGREVQNGDCAASVVLKSVAHHLLPLKPEVGKHHLDFSVALHRTFQHRDGFEFLPAFSVSLSSRESERANRPIFCTAATAAWK